MHQFLYYVTYIHVYVYFRHLYKTFSDFFEVPEFDVKDLRKIFKVNKEIDWDPEGVALLATRMFVRPILMERMKCPAAVFDMTIISKFNSPQLIKSKSRIALLWCF